MSIHPSMTILIAQTDSRLESFSSGFRKNRAQFDSADLVLFLAGLAVVFAVVWLVARWSERRVRTNSSLGLFWTLAKAHAINWNDRWLLWRIARAKGVVEPALLFLDPRLTSPQLVRHLAPQAADRLKAFRRTVFFNIDHLGDDEGDSGVTEREEVVAGQWNDFEIPAGPPGSTFPLAPTGELAEVLGAMRAFSLQDQLVPKGEPQKEPAPDRPEERPAPTAEFPASQAPVLDLYPWLGKDWEITNVDQQDQ